MPLVDYSLEIVARVLREVDAEPARTGRVLCLSTPDVIAARATVRGIFGPAVDGVPARPDSDAIANWHKAQHITREVLDTRALFQALGYEMDAVDRTAGRGGELLHDLSDPMPADWPGRGAYDLVFDCISNQVFNVAQAWWTMVSACRVGGRILSVTPVTMVNQGFWDVSPAAYRDFCDANGLALDYRSILGVYVRCLPAETLGTYRRERRVPDDTMNVALMTKVEARDRPVWPVMTKFKNHPTCSLAPGAPR